MNSSARITEALRISGWCLHSLANIQFATIFLWHKMACCLYSLYQKFMWEQLIMTQTNVTTLFSAASSHTRVIHFVLFFLSLPTSAACSSPQLPPRALVASGSRCLPQSLQWKPADPHKTRKTHWHKPRPPNLPDLTRARCLNGSNFQVRTENRAHIQRERICV